MSHGGSLTDAVEDRAAAEGPGERSIEFELEWDENREGAEGGSDSLEIE